MKKRTIIIISIIVIIIIIILGYFSIQQFNLIKSELENKTDDQSTENETIFNKEFGSYKLPKDWIESKEHSTKEKLFYVLKGQEKDRQPNNISINVGKNRYPKTEHEQFRKAILNQLLIQVRNQKGVEVNANGSTTDNGEIVYAFITKNNDVITTQYYIVGDYKYILIQETLFEESEETKEATKSIIDSFKWKE